uniref:Essential MCU regulator, mitochondrial n=1 Tax=Monopterus albus TaxID=43700 RepID=A0A3Q3PY02_MONAL|nr:essential MCU regulator, mitochondrial-like [Monopterus albus]
MATSILRLPLRLSMRKTGILSHNTSLKTSNIFKTPHIRTRVSTATGAILPKPEKTPFGLTRMTIVVVPFLYMGTQISKSFATLLEEHDIFVPDDDDDDD